MGGRTIFACAGLTDPEKANAARHEFGHIFGLDDAYVEATQQSLVGFERDVMGVRYGGLILPYHSLLLLQMY